MANRDAFEIPQHIIDREAAKRSDRIIQVVCLAVAGLCVLGAAAVVPSVNAERQEYQLVVDPDSLQGLPPDIRLLTKTGTFRALAIDWGFMRMERLKNEDKFFELMQLSSWLCRLAPRYPTIWSYAAWNQAYNISVAQYTPEARWKWVSNGIRLLRDEGIQYNPKSLLLYKELAWTYWHKVGDFTDDYHWEYKKELAVDMERVVGAPPLALTDEETIDAFRKIAEAPRDVPGLIRSDAKVAALVEQLGAVDLAADRTLLEFVARYMRDDIQVAALLKLDEHNPIHRLLLDRTRLLADPAHAAALETLLAALRAHALRTRYFMEPERMLELMEEFGPLDWRLPYGMSLYWSSEGDRVTKDLTAVDPNVSMNTVRLVFFSLDSMVRRGRLLLEPNFSKPNDSFLQLLPDHRFIRRTHDALLKYGKEQATIPELHLEGRYPGLLNYRVGHVNFLRYSIRQLWWMGTPKARADSVEYYQWLREFDREANGDPKPFYLQPIEAAVMAEIYEGLTSFKNAQMIINDFLFRSLDELAAGNLPAAQGYLDVARQGWEYYMADKFDDNVERRRIPSLDIMRRNAALEYLRARHVTVLKKVRAWRALELETRQFCYDKALPYMVRLCEAHAPPLNLDAVFHEPPGMKEFRELQEEQGQLEPDLPEIERGEKAPT
ncbi:MAG: hypothetical protein GY842_20700 [bacterium]|nr:hypothetical protein [bacterium]